MSSDRALGSQVAELLINGKQKQVLSLDTASHLQQKGRMGRTSYQDTRLILKQQTAGITLPAWNLLREHQLTITPQIFNVTSPKGVRCDYKTALSLTIERVLLLLPPEEFQHLGEKLIFSFEDGVDGSGGHPIYNQLNNEDTHNIIMYMFSCLKASKDGNDEAFWSEEAPNSPLSQRPLFLLLGKENKDNIKCIKEVFLERTLNTTLHIEIKGRHFEVSIVCTMSSIDGKMRKLLSGRGGAWCIHCEITRDEAAGRNGEDLEALQNLSWEITRNFEETQRIWSELSTDTEASGGA